MTTADIVLLSLKEENMKLILSGFSIDYEDAVTTSSKKNEGFEVIDCERLDEWVAVAYSLP
ncbi:hypothetical protein [Fischerella thermalis]|jgi:ribosomal protein L11 methylase PrmA|uniref:Uncharacterized protein n=1 Tax=Fischerella thermalis JSC-11 TaxID=741277 RepID=G6FRX3_9CYAN|nr:hypothetical protein [Fischerella thermalis]EHC16197.1 hypothetical protein FJSC11DRAFT_1620 [Fischerella thermalis JSC-11]PLZ12920.1 hypothetical protein CBP17_06700 [Fischerella thermalis WC114]PLZ14623.1 hypothetical protein CBP18_01710 [Fischerella thermalis WC119]PLZ15711.1 hypothetical protein CBP19_06690 [Fischerella thermalis WC1110]PLZ23287.1 hypothetical protein CBP30_04610 [Fischerella thermalis WC157]